jgi:hypothetical protein
VRAKVQDKSTARQGKGKMISRYVIKGMRDEKKGGRVPLVLGLCRPKDQLNPPTGDNKLYIIILYYTMFTLYTNLSQFRYRFTMHTGKLYYSKYDYEVTSTPAKPMHACKTKAMKYETRKC